MPCYKFLAIICLPKMVLNFFSRITPVACVLLAQWGKMKVESANTGKLATKLPMTLLSLQSDTQHLYHDISF